MNQRLNQAIESEALVKQVLEERGLDAPIDAVAEDRSVAEPPVFACLLFKAREAASALSSALQEIDSDGWGNYF